MGARTAQRREQVDALFELVGAAMERRGAPPGISARAVATVALAMFQGLMRQRRIDPDRVSGDLLASAGCSRACAQRRPSRRSSDYRLGGRCGHSGLESREARAGPGVCYAVSGSWGCSAVR
jgi:hypothetical protein